MAQPLFGGPIVVIAIMSSKSPSSNTGRSPSSRRESLKLPFVVAVLASCSYIIAADQKSGEVMLNYMKMVLTKTQICLSLLLVCIGDAAVTPQKVRELDRSSFGFTYAR